MTTSRRTITLAAVALAGVLAVSCGGDDAPAATPTTETTETTTVGMDRREAAQVAAQYNAFVDKYQAEYIVLAAYPKGPDAKPNEFPVEPGEHITTDMVLAAQNAWDDEISEDDAASIVAVLGPLFAEHGHDAVTFVADANALNTLAREALAD